MIFRKAQLYWILPVLAIFMRVASTPTANVSYLVIAFYALLGRAQAIHALTLSWLFTMLNPGIAPEATAASVGRYAVVAFAAVSVLIRSIGALRTLKFSYPVIMTVLLGVFLVAHSFFLSPVTDVSVLKALSWTIAMSTILAAWSGLPASEHVILTRQIFGGLIFLLLFSLPLLSFDVGYLRNGTGFQGLLSHPQAFGPTMALLGAWAAGRLFSERRSPWWTAIVVAACLVMVLLSEARTAGLALVLGATIALLVTPALSDKPAGQVLVGLRTKRFYLVAGLTFIVLLTNASTISEDVSAYISKSRRAEVRTLAQAYELSRGAMIVEMWENFKARPFQGIGFGVSSDPEEMIVQRDPLSGLPISATVEKGVLPLAVLEELGVFGLLAVLLWLWMLMRRSARGGGITALLVLFVALLTNMGESVLFSPGGMGLLSLVLVGWAASQRSEVSVEVSNA